MVERTSLAHASASWRILGLRTTKYPENPRINVTTNRQIQARMCTQQQHNLLSALNPDLEEKSLCALCDVLSIAVGALFGTD